MEVHAGHQPLGYQVDQVMRSCLSCRLTNVVSLIVKLDRDLGNSCQSTEGAFCVCVCVFMGKCPTSGSLLDLKRTGPSPRAPSPHCKLTRRISCRCVQPSGFAKWQWIMSYPIKLSESSGHCNARDSTFCASEKGWFPSLPIVRDIPMAYLGAVQTKSVYRLCGIIKSSHLCSSKSFKLPLHLPFIVVSAKLPVLWFPPVVLNRLRPALLSSWKEPDDWSVRVFSTFPARTVDSAASKIPFFSYFQRLHYLEEWVPRGNLCITGCLKARQSDSFGIILADMRQQD